jgi:hypothetical protein
MDVYEKRIKSYIEKEKVNLGIKNPEASNSGLSDDVLKRNLLSPKYTEYMTNKTNGAKEEVNAFEITKSDQKDLTANKFSNKTVNSLFADSPNVSNSESNLYKEFLELVKSKDDEILKIKENHEKELKFQNDIHNQHICNINKTWLDELTKLKNLYENRLEELSKNKEKKENISDFQKKYLQEMEELQNTFHTFKMKTYDEFRNMKRQNEEIYYKMVYYKEKYENILVENKQLQDKIYQSNNEIINTFGNTNDVKFK